MRLHIPSLLPIHLPAAPRRTEPRLAPFFLWLLLALLTSSAWVDELHAQWSTDPAVNTTVWQHPTSGILAYDGFQTVPDGAGGFFVLWCEAPWYRPCRIRCQRMNASGIRQWGSEGIILSDTTYNAFLPSCTSDSSGGLIAVWVESYGNRNDDSASVRINRIDANGQVLWNKLMWYRQLIRAASAILPVTSNERGNALLLVVLRDSTLRLQRFDSFGNSEWNGDGKIVGKLNNARFNSSDKSLISDREGGAFVAWVKHGKTYPFPSQSEFRAQHVDSSGNLRWGHEGSAIRFIPGSTSSVEGSLFSHLAVDGTGGVFAAFSSPDATDTMQVITMQRLSRDGMRMWDSSGIAIGKHLLQNLVFRPQLLSLRKGVVAIHYNVWPDNVIPQQLNNKRAWMQAVDTSGRLLWSSGSTVPMADTSMVAGILQDKTGGMYVAYMTNSPNTNRINQLRIQRYDSAGMPLWETVGKVVSLRKDFKVGGNIPSRNTYGEQFPVLMADGAGGMFVVWQGDVNVTEVGPEYTGIFATRLHSDGTPYPVELMLFTATLEGSEVHLHWQTASETNNHGFEIERSYDGITWAKLGFVPGYGTTLQPREYDYLDPILPDMRQPVLHYRLRQIDYDGTASYSPVVRVQISEQPSAFAMEIYPHPVTPTANAMLSIPIAGAYHITLTDMLGRELQTVYDGWLNAGTSFVPLKGERLAAGTYVVRVSSGAGIVKHVVIVKE